MRIVIATAALATSGLFNSVAWAYSQIPTHKHLSKDALVLLHGEACAREVLLYEKDIEDATVAEDEGSRCAHHFYDPTTHLGLAPNGYTRLFFELYLKSNPVLPSLEDGARYMNAPNWGRDGMPDGFGWEAAIEAYGDSSRGETGHQDAWRALGHVLHLVQDMAQPDHARNRPHPGNSLTDVFDKLRIGGGHFVGYEALWAEPTMDEKWKHGSKPRALESMEQAFDEMSKKSQEAETRVGVPWKDEAALGLGPYEVTYELEAAALIAIITRDGADAIPMRDSMWKKYELKIALFPRIPTAPANKRTEAYVSLGNELLPLAEEYSAGLIQLFYRIVNSPPIVTSVELTQEGDEVVRYHGEWNSSSSGRQLKKSGPGDLISGKSTTIRVEFGPEITLVGQKFIEDVDEPAVFVEEGEGTSKQKVKVPKEKFEGNVWVGKFVPHAAGTVVIEARDRDPHFERRKDKGDLLDSDPSSIAHAGKKHPFDWIGYEPGADRNHHFSLGGSCPPGAVSPELVKNLRWGEIQGTFRWKTTGEDGERDPQDKEDPEWTWSGSWSGEEQIHGRVHLADGAKEAEFGHPLDESLLSLGGKLTVLGPHSGEYFIHNEEKPEKHVERTISGETRKHGRFYQHVTIGQINGKICANGNLEGNGRSTYGSPDWIEGKRQVQVSLHETTPIWTKHFETAQWSWSISIRPVKPPEFAATCAQDHDPEKLQGARLKFETSVTGLANGAFMSLARDRRIAEIQALGALFGTDLGVFENEAKLREGASSIERACEQLGYLWIEADKEEATTPELNRLEEGVALFEAAEKTLADDAVAWAEKIAAAIEPLDAESAKTIRVMAKKVRDVGLLQYASGKRDSTTP
jgi:hypothetical protein